jgi:hypothetical protein
MEEMGNACRMLVGKPEWKRLLWKPRNGWKNNIKMDVMEI